MIVSPVTSPTSNTTSYLAGKQWWVPPGDWLDVNFHSTLTGNVDGSTFVTTLYSLNDIPVLVKAGSVVTTLPSVLGDTIGVAGRQYTSLIHTIYPGASTGKVSC